MIVVRTVTTAVLFAAIVAGCGGSSPAEDIRAMEYSMLDAAEHDRVGDFCRNYVHQPECLGQVAAAKVLGIKLSDTLKGTERDVVKQMRITVKGDRATTSGGHKLVRRNGRWLLEDEFKS